MPLTLGWNVSGEIVSIGANVISLKKVNIDSEFTLEQIAQAHERSESGRAQGKIIINVCE